MKLLRFFISRTFFLNLVLAVAAAAGIFQAAIWSLEAYTHHGESITVPDLRGLTLSQAAGMLNNKELRYMVNDSSFFEPGKMPYTILDQDPKPMSLAKKNRTIYLGVNAKNPPRVKMPNLKDSSFELAMANLKLLKLELGETVYEPDAEFNSVNIVLDQKRRGQSIEPGTSIFQGDTIDLVLSSGDGDMPIPLPDLKGKTLPEAKFMLQSSYLNVGLVKYAPGTHDSSGAKVFRQVPPYFEYAELRMGEFVDLWLSDKPVEDTAGLN